MQKNAGCLILYSARALARGAQSSYLEKLIKSVLIKITVDKKLRALVKKTLSRARRAEKERRGEYNSAVYTHHEKIISCNIFKFPSMHIYLYIHVCKTDGQTAFKEGNSTLASIVNVIERTSGRFGTILKVRGR